MICSTPHGGAKHGIISGGHSQDRRTQTTFLPLSNLTLNPSQTCSAQEGDLHPGGQAGVHALRVCAASSCLARSSFLAHIQPIIRQILKGERRLPAQMTSCGLCSYLSRCGICLPGKAAGGSRFTRGKLHLSAVSSQIPSSVASASAQSFHFQDFPELQDLLLVGNGEGEGKGPGRALYPGGCSALIRECPSSRTGRPLSSTQSPAQS